MKKWINRSNLITKLSNRLNHIPKQDILDSTAILLDKITESLARGHRVEIRGFGSLSSRERSSRIGRNPSSGESILINSKNHAYYRAAKRLKADLN